NRKDAMIGPRFEQTDLEVQPNSAAAIDLIAEEPIHYVEGRIAICDGGI
ncbi:4002_t:CDS:2, partial [Cetraspora pellucida]